MGKLDYYSEGRRDGLLMALEIVSRGGEQALREEIEFRKITGLNTGLPKKEMTKIASLMKDRVFATVCLMPVATLHDQFGFGEKRVKKYGEYMQYASDLLLADMATWDDYAREVKERLNFEVYEWWNEKVKK